MEFSNSSEVSGSGTEKAQSRDVVLLPGNADVEETSSNVDDYPNIFRRTYIVIGVALSLFLVNLWCFSLNFLFLPSRRGANIITF